MSPTPSQRARTSPSPRWRPSTRRTIQAGGAVGLLVLLTGCAHSTRQTSGTYDGFAELQWKVFFLPLLLIGFAIVVAVFSLVAAIVSLQSAARGTRMRRWPLIASSVLLGSLAIGGTVVFVLRLVSNDTITIAVAGFGG